MSPGAVSPMPSRLVGPAETRAMCGDWQTQRIAGKDFGLWLPLCGTSFRDRELRLKESLIGQSDSRSISGLKDTNAFPSEGWHKACQPLNRHVVMWEGAGMPLRFLTTTNKKEKRPPHICWDTRDSVWSHAVRC